MRFLALAAPLAILAVAGCSSGTDNYAAMTTSGVGFGDYQRYLRDREGARSSAPYSVPPETRQSPILPPAAMPGAAPSTLDAVPQRPAAPAPVTPPLTATPLAPLAPVAAPAAPIISQPLNALQPAAPMPQPPVSQPPVATAALTTPAAVAEAPRSGIRDAQTYHADAPAGAAVRSGAPAPAEIVTVASVPPPAVGGPNLMAYALTTTHAPGTEVYRRINPMRWSRWENACLQYRNQDAAQIAFLEAGGPDRDRHNLDPDGDGFACWWDPRPLRQAASR